MTVIYLIEDLWTTPRRRGIIETLTCVKMARKVRCGNPVSACNGRAVLGARKVGVLQEE